MTTIKSEKNQHLLNLSKIFMGYLPAGYPDKSSFLELPELCCKNGMDIVEVGFPSKNPFADGEIIRQAHSVIDHSLSTDINYWRLIRESCSNPLWIMGYREDLVESGMYLKLAQEGLVDAFVIPDNDEDSFDNMQKQLAPLNVDMIRFLRPSCTEEEIRKCFQNSALVYYQLFEGTTGSTKAADSFTEVLSIASEYSHLRILAGFGINSPNQAESLVNAGFDGFIIGTAMVRELNKSVQSLLNFVEQFNYKARRASA